MDIVSANNGMDNQGNYTYYAFISYQRKDEKWAKWLQRKLENYKLPVANAKEASEKKSKYIRPVFRDKTDLTAGPLPEALKEALQQSRYLIVICSPNALQSPWVNEEIETFTKAGRTDYVIPFIVDGEPYSKDAANECFPNAIKDIPKDKEPLGVNIHENGKERAFIRTVAYMLNVKFDELWNRFERHRRKIRNITIACLTFLALLAFGIYDYTRTKVEYYADWVDCNGVAQGVIPLNNDQVKHRYASFKFEYTRVPFGEKGFYSWRLNRVSIVNSKGVISSSTPDNHSFFYPIQEYKYTDGYVTEIINRDTYNRVVMRYTIKDDYDHKVACLVDMEGKEKHQGSAYLSGSTTAFLSDSNQNMSKIKRFHYTRNEKGYVTKVTYHANDADELDESAIGDNNNIYGKLFELDEFGRVTKVTYINHEGKPMTDKYGVGYIRYNNASFEGNDTIEYLGSDGELAYNEHRYARQINKLDKYGNPIESYNEGADGKACYDYKNIYREVISFDENGCLTEMKYYGFDGNLSYCSDNYAIQRVKYDSKGRYIEVSHYDVNDKPCYIKGNFSISRVKYNSNDCIIEQSVYDINDKPCIETVQGTHMTCIDYDDYNYQIQSTVYNENGELMVSPVLHVAKQTRSYNNYHQLISAKCFDENGKPCFYNDNTSETKAYYDTRGNIVKMECLDTEGKPCICKEGYATITYKYDAYGNKAEECYYGVEGEPIYIDMCSSVQYDYYPNGLLKEERYYDEKGKLCLNKNWYAIIHYEYDSNGRQTSVSFYDTDTIPCYYKDGLYSCMEFRYDNNGNKIKEIFYDTKGNVSLMTKGLYAIAEYKYDKYHRITEYAFFDENEIPCFYNLNEYHKVRTEYDGKGKVIRYSYYDTSQRPYASKNAVGVKEYKYDIKGNCIQIAFKDEKSKPINMNQTEHHLINYVFDEYNRCTDVSYINKSNNLCSHVEWLSTNQCFSYSRIHYDYDEKNNIIKYSYFNQNDALINGPCYINCSYDELNRQIEVRYYNNNNKLTNGWKYHKAIESYKYDSMNHLSDLFLFNKDSTLYSHSHWDFDMRGLPLTITNRDKNGELFSVLIPGAMDTKYAIRKSIYDERGLNIQNRYYGTTNELENIDDGFSIINNSFDQYGRLTKQELYDYREKPVHSKVQGWHRHEIKYDNRGLIIEHSFFDEDSKYVNVNNVYLSGGCKVTIEHDDKGNVVHSPIYESVNGRPVLAKNSEPILPESKKVPGCLIGFRVELPGHFQDKGFSGLFFLIKWNEWDLYKSLDDFSDVFSNSFDIERHLIFVPWENINGKWGLGKVIETIFPKGTLGIRIMDYNNVDDIFNNLVDIYEEYKRFEQ